MNAPVHTRTFKSGNSVAMRFPKRFGVASEVDLQIVPYGKDFLVRRVVDPVSEKTRLSAFIARLRAMPAPDLIETRDTSEIPERSGL